MGLDVEEWEFNWGHIKFRVIHRLNFHVYILIKNLTLCVIFILYLLFKK